MTQDIELPVVYRFDAAASKLVWISQGSHKNRRNFRHIFRTSEPAVQHAIREFAASRRLQTLFEEVINESDENC